MPNSILGDNLVDSLIVDVVDGLRSSLYPQMGVRQYEVTLVRRLWSGGQIGSGTPTPTQRHVLEPQPRVQFGEEPDRLGPDFGCGRVESGTATLTEVSLQLTEDELHPIPAAGVEFYYEISDAHGQSIATTYWIPVSNPTPDREMTLGWIVRLRRYEPAATLPGV